MKSIMNQRNLSVLGVIAGTSLFVTGITITNEDLKGVSAVCIGAGAALFSLSLGYFFSHLMKRHNPAIRRAQKISDNDERNIIIRDKAVAKTNTIFMWLLFAVMLLFIALDTDLWVVLTLSGIVLANGIVNIAYAYYFGKRL